MIDPNDKIGNINLYDFSNAIATLKKLDDKLNDLGIELVCCDEYNKVKTASLSSQTFFNSSSFLVSNPLK